MLYFGSIVIIKTFKGHLKRNETITIKSKPVITSIVYFLILIQCCIVIFQIHELARYYEDIAEHETTMTYEGNAEVTGPYYLGVVSIPSLSQLILLPTIWAMLIYRSKYALNGTYAFLMSCWLNCFSWCATITAIVYRISAYD